MYLTVDTPTPIIRYLVPTINEKGQKLIKEIKNSIRNLDSDVSEKELETSGKVLKICNNRHYWKYSLNVRGFILYLLGLTKTDERKWNNKEEGPGIRPNERKRGRKKPDMSYDKRRIDKTLEALSDNWLKDFSFLLYYRDLKKVLPRNFITDLFQQIAEELQYQLDISNIDFLKYWVIRRYYDAIANNLGPLEHIKNIDLQTLKKLKNHRAKMLNYMVKYLSDEAQHRKKALESYEAG